ncbi:Riboflavin biosynthesis protein RibBA [Commensalibacter sp. Nvir]|uniref:3,4-dihydroxy-2-butanone-4-phosphate synthase n=1 Tax=Commensalibacter sp. Nvir TaxID=3069817 RepID=UPI002D706553|nr:Riboflavin biosynthesis protein RibBA [Commensalibacter sp. Nvir]
MLISEIERTLPKDLKEAVHALRSGKMIIMMDDEGRENEGDLVAAGELVSEESINFMVTHARGIVCIPIEMEKAQRLNLKYMVPHNTSPHETAFTVSIEAKKNVSTGVSVKDRVQTIQSVAQDDAGPEDIVTPGHMFPLIAHPGGVLSRQGHTEGSIDLLKLAGMKPVAVICEILNEDGSMARKKQLHDFSKKHQLPIVTVSSLVKWRQHYDALSPDGFAHKIKSGPIVRLPNYYGGDDFKTQAFVDLKGNEHLVVMKGDFSGSSDIIPLIRLHSECLTGDVFGSLRCDCGPQLHKALKIIGESEKGALIYLRGHEGRGIGLFNKICAYKLQDEGMDTVEANIQLGFPSEMRDWTIAGAILHALGIHHLRLLTNNNDKVNLLEQQGFVIEERVPLEIEPNRHNMEYLQTKKSRMGHTLSAVSIKE